MTYERAQEGLEHVKPPPGAPPTRRAEVPRARTVKRLAEANQPDVR